MGLITPNFKIYLGLICPLEIEDFNYFIVLGDWTYEHVTRFKFEVNVRVRCLARTHGDSSILNSHSFITYDSVEPQRLGKN